jgi:hypothetical protein
MANNENAFQVELKKAIIAAGGNCIRMRHESIGGIPDLYVNHPEFPSLWIECKFLRSGTGKPGRLRLTEQQRAFLRLDNKLLGNAGWALCVKHDTLWSMYAGRGAPTRYEEEDLIQTRKIGQTWNAMALMQKVTGT